MSNQKQQIDKIFTLHYTELLNYTKRIVYNKQYYKYEPEEILSTAYETLIKKTDACLDLAYIKRIILQLIVWYRSTLNYTDFKYNTACNSISDKNYYDTHQTTLEDDYAFNIDLEQFGTTLNYDEKSMLDLIIKDKTRGKDIAEKFNVSPDTNKIRQLQKTIKEVKHKFNIYYKNNHN